MSKLYFRYGAMNAGKSTAILQVAHNYEERGMKVVIAKPKVDTKGDDKIVSRLNIERKVDVVLDSNDKVCEKIDLFEKIDAIIVDEVQFLEEKQIDELYYISKIYNIPVLCYGLRCDFQMKGFKGATRLLQIADDIEELKTICECGKKATQNLRLVNDVPVFDGEQIAIDNSANISYKSVCGNCYIRLRKKLEDK